ncbi:hypothetical protein BD626DRAFT_587095 [Schizophyllum amplum]|uniref:Uncharacterized protein n=1 Tax=Schizophyllum amplum TaxID=97359 RepID=A0A550BW29_9AGAR|nr:hypothetical protein BD626DRAFT_587095 [Auriculariopsis ampla]
MINALSDTMTPDTESLMSDTESIISATESLMSNSVVSDDPSESEWRHAKLKLTLFNLYDRYKLKLGNPRTFPRLVRYHFNCMLCPDKCSWTLKVRENAKPDDEEIKAGAAKFIEHVRAHVDEETHRLQTNPQQKKDYVTGLAEGFSIDVRACTWRGCSHPARDADSLIDHIVRKHIGPVTSAYCPLCNARTGHVKDFDRRGNSSGTPFKLTRSLLRHYESGKCAVLESRRGAQGQCRCLR